MAREEERVFTNFSPSDAVEVSADDDGFRGAWYEAKVLRPLRRAGSYAVVYDHLLAGGDENLRPLHEIVHASHVRPRPPLHSALLLVPHRPVDAWYNDGWWVGVVMAAISGRGKGKNRRYNVCFPISREEMVFEEAHLRVHLEWVDNQWIDPELITSGSVAAEAYPLGFQVEVSHDSGASLCAWFVAAVEKHIWNNNLLVKYQKLAADGGEDRRREIVHLQHVRPRPPAPSSGEPGLLEEVEVLHECGWCAGVVSKILPGLKYSVKSEHWDGELEFHQDDVRLRQEWTNGRWVLPAKDIWGRLGLLFTRGTKVEVSSDDDGFCGVWYAATVEQPLSPRTFLVEYDALRTDDGAEPLREGVDAFHIRPPPEAPAVNAFKLLEEVDAYYNDGWWVGVISRVLGGSRYGVYFRYSEEELAFGHADLRPHLEWINGRWVQASQAILPPM